MCILKSGFVSPVHQSLYLAGSLAYRPTPISNSGYAPGWWQFFHSCSFTAIRKRVRKFTGSLKSSSIIRTFSVSSCSYTVHGYLFHTTYTTDCVRSFDVDALQLSELKLWGQYARRMATLSQRERERERERDRESNNKKFVLVSSSFCNFHARETQMGTPAPRSDHTTQHPSSSILQTIRFSTTNVLCSHRRRNVEIKILKTLKTWQKLTNTFVNIAEKGCSTYMPNA